MKKNVLIFCLTVLCFTTKVIAQKDVVDVVATSEEHTTLVAAIKAADLVQTLKEEGPFTVFAPTNSAFEALPKGTVEKLLKPESKDVLSNLLTYHVIAGNFQATDILAAIKKDGGNFVLKTLSGATLTASIKDGNVILIDGTSNIATIITTGLKASNGVIHIIDKVVMPEQDK